MPELPTGDWFCQSSHHFSVGGWIVVMSFRSEAFSLDFCHIKFWRGVLEVFAQTTLTIRVARHQLAYLLAISPI